ncbi:MAG TPA: tail fiber domain-containing protein [Candidatus Binataceae bacterium]|nr:tail fiber domain-containing protein [Candidatus Binataceae bacterium]
MANLTYQRSFQHRDWFDGQDIVQAGGERGFNVEFHSLEAEFDNISTVINQINTELAFQPVGAGGAVVYAGGNVGVGAGFSAAAPPTHRLEVNLGDNTATTERVRFGNAVCCNGGAGAFAGYAIFSHKSHAFDTDYALQQGPNGNVHINATGGQPVSIRQNGTSIRLGISPAGNVIVGPSEADLPGAPANAVLQVAGDAFKAAGGTQWAPSDARVKQDVRDLEAGLTQLRQVRPVRFRYNGLAGTPAGREGVGVLGQEIEKVFPETIRLTSCILNGEAHFDDFRIFDGSALTYVLINAVKELAQKVDQLEEALAEARTERRADGTVG